MNESNLMSSFFLFLSQMVVFSGVRYSLLVFANIEGALETVSSNTKNGCARQNHTKKET